MTDRELTVLKAIAHVGRGGLALISDVIKALGYPRATVKKTLIGLSEKGIVSLHRHDYPGSLTKAELDLMVKLKGNYYNAVTVRKQNPRRKNKTIIKAKRVVVARRAIVLNPKKKPARKRASNKDYPYWNVYHVDTRKTAPYDKTFLGSSSFGVTKAEAIEKFRRSHYPGRLRPGTKIVAEKAVITKNPKRRRNLDHRDSKHQVEVSRHWRAGGLSQWQRAHKAGQHDLFAHGIKARNPLAKDSAKWEKLWSAYIKALSALDKPIKGSNARAATARLAKAEKAIQKFDPDAYKRLILGRKNPKRNASISRATKPASKRRAGASRVRRKTKKRSAKRNPTTLKKLVSKAVKAVKRVVKGKRNPSAGAAGDLRKTFAGRHTRDDRLIFPDGTPQGLAKLGQLVSIDTDAGRIKPVKGTAWLCADTRGKLHIGTPTKGHVVFGGPAQNYGYVREIEYSESKPHLGYAKKTLFFHKLGEETGVKPRLVTDGKGGAKFVGGAYQIKREGIIN